MKKTRQMRLIVGSTIIVAGFAVLVSNGLKSNTLRALPVSELCAADNTPRSHVGQRLRVVGFVSHQPVKKERTQTSSGVVDVNHFTIVENGRELAVRYSDALPDTFRAGAPVQVDGLYQTAGLVVAEHVYTKCPSKYEASAEAKKEKSLGAKPLGAKIQEAEGKRQAALPLANRPAK